MRKLVCCEEAVGQILNLGNDQLVTIEELARLVRRISNSDIIYVHYEQAYERGFEDMQSRVPDLAKAKKLIGYCPRVTLSETIERVITHEMSRLPQSVEFVASTGASRVIQS